MNARHWKDSSVQRLILGGAVAWPLIAATASLLAVVFWNQSFTSLLAATGYGLLLGLAGSLLTACGVSFAGAVSGGIFINVAFSIAFAAALQKAGDLNVLLTGFRNLGPTVGAAGGIAAAVEIGPAAGTVISIAVGAAGFFAANPAAPDMSHSTVRQTGGIVVGILVAGAIYGLAISGTIMMPRLAAYHTVWVALIFSGIVGLAMTMTIRLRTNNWTRALIAGGAAFIVMYLVVWIPYHAAIGDLLAAVITGSATALFYSSLFASSFAAAREVAGPWAGAVASAIASGGAFTFFLMRQQGPSFPWFALPLSVAFNLVGLALPRWQPIVLYPIEAAWNQILFVLDRRRAANSPSLLRRHSAFWHEHQFLRLYGLEDHLLFVLQNKSDEGQRALNALATGRQSWAAQAAQIEIDALMLHACTDVRQLRSAHHLLMSLELESPAAAILRQLRDISRDVDAALNQVTASNQKMMLLLIERRIDDLGRDLTRSGQSYAARFWPILQLWRRTIAEQIAAIVSALREKQEIENPYVIGIPLSAEQEIFVGRTAISSTLADLALKPNTPPLLLYGHRRMGKTSLLRNLGRLLPTSIAPLFVDLQGPASLSSSHAGFLLNVVKGMRQSAETERRIQLPPISKAALASDPFTAFDHWLDGVEAEMGGRPILLALDEFEAMENAFLEGRLIDTQVLGMLRHLIQHRPRFKVLIAGSHTLDEFQRWARYLVNLQIVHIGYLEDGEARQLIVRPIKHFALQYGPGAVERILYLTSSHPYLIQLLCFHLVMLKNEHSIDRRGIATVDDVETASPRALASGSIFFWDICHQVDAAGMEILKFIASFENSGASGGILTDRFPASAGVRALLTRRGLVEMRNGNYRVPIEMMRRWLHEVHRHS